MGNAVYAANGGARLIALESQIKRFERTYRRRLRKFTRTSSRHGDLLFTFPALPFALVSGHGTTDQRGAAMQLVRDGAPLARIAAALDVPAWLRRLPPEAFTRPLGRVAVGEVFARKIVGRLPAEVDMAAAWLKAHEVAVEAGSEDFAYWLAAQPIYGASYVAEPPVRPLAIFAWFSRESGVRGRRLIEKPWTKQMRFDHAVQQMAGWYERIMVDLTRADVKRGPGRYSRRRKMSGYEMVPLRSAAELDEEGRIMNNCVGSYAGMVAARECLIFSVRRGSRRVATMEIRWMRGEPRIWQLEGPSNTSADPALFQAATQWLSEQDGLFRMSRQALEGLSVDATRWTALWLPYVTAKGGKAAQLDRPNPQALARLLGDAEQLVEGLHRRL